MTPAPIASVRPRSARSRGRCRQARTRNKRKGEKTNSPRVGLKSSPASPARMSCRKKLDSPTSPYPPPSAPTTVTL